MKSDTFPLEGAVGSVAGGIFFALGQLLTPGGDLTPDTLLAVHSGWSAITPLVNDSHRGAPGGTNP